MPLKIGFDGQPIRNEEDAIRSAEEAKAAGKTTRPTTMKKVKVIIPKKKTKK